MTTAVQGVPISELQAATLPLTGAELVPLVQSGVTRQAASSAFGGATGAISWTGVLAAALAAGATNNWAPDLTGISRIEVTAAGAADVSGLVGGTDGRVVVITNAGANDVNLLAQSALSTAANRFASNGDTFLPGGSGASALFIYSGALSRWTRIGF